MNSTPVRQEDDDERDHRDGTMLQHDLQRAVVDFSMLSKAALGDLTELRRLGVLCGFLRKRLHSIASAVTETTPEIRIATQIVTENSGKRRPSTPPMKSTGMKTAARESVIDTIVKPISREPTSDAVSGSSPISTWR